MDNEISPFNSLEELHAELTKIDGEMRSAGVRPHQRPFRGWHVLSSRKGLGLRQPSPIENPQPDDLSWGALTAHIFAWFEQRYGKRANAVFVPSAGAIDIDGDLFRLSVPILWGQVNFEINPRRLDFKYRPIIKDRVPKGNVLNTLDGMTQAYAESISITHYSSIANQAGMIFWVYNEMMAHHFQVLANEASVDIDAGVASLLDGVSPGHARWCFHQAAEKSIKALLQHEGVQRTAYFKAGHNLPDLIALSSKLRNSKALKPAVVDAVTCSPKARYGEITTSVREAFVSYQNALDVILESLRMIVPATRRFAGVVVYPGPFPGNQFDPAIDGCGEI